MVELAQNDFGGEQAHWQSLVASDHELEPRAGSPLLSSKAIDKSIPGAMATRLSR
jgi:hypothetical protein